jgi:mono/diheme cytochrome c family protein
MKRYLLVFALGVVTFPALGIVVARLGLWPTRANIDPPSWERALAEPSLRASLKRHAPALKNPHPVSEETLLAGMKIFRTNCAGCHGEPGRPSSWGTKGFYPRVPQLADAPSQLSDAEMFFVVKNGIRYSGMGAWDGMISDNEIWQVATFLSNTKSLPEPVAAAWTKP